MEDFIRRDLTALAQRNEIDPVIGREDLINEVITLVTQPGKASVVLTGEPGVGKTSIAEGVAVALVSHSETAQWRIVELDCNALVAGTVYRGQFEERAQRLLTELARQSRTVIFVDELHTILGVGAVSETPSPFANLLKPYLANGDIRMLGATTNDEYEQFRRHDAAFCRRFLRIDIPEPSPSATVAIVQQVASKRAGRSGVILQQGTAEAVVEVAQRVYPQRRFPDRALDVLAHCISAKQDECKRSTKAREDGGRVQELFAIVNQEIVALQKQDWIRCRALARSWLEQRQNCSASVLTPADVGRIASARYGLIDTRDASSIAKIMSLRDRLLSQVTGQDRAVDAVCEAMKRVMALGHSARPVGSFLFLGPTGVGKTELSRALARELWGSSHLLQLDMSEYMDKEAAAKLIGAPPGYVGYDEGGRLVRAVAAEPRLVVLFDEIEKAHPDVHNLLLQILEEGQLRDSTGKTCSFSDCIVILRSRRVWRGKPSACPYSSSSSSHSSSSRSSSHS